MESKYQSFAAELLEAIDKLKKTIVPDIPEDKILVVSSKEVYETFIGLGIKEEKIYYVPLENPQTSYLIPKSLFDQRPIQLRTPQHEDDHLSRFQIIPTPKNIYRADLKDLGDGCIKLVNIFEKDK